MTKRLILVLLLCLSAFPVMAQEDATEERSFIDLFFGSFAVTKERIVNRLPVDDYEITIEAQRFANDAYLEIYISENGTAIAPDTPVTVAASLTRTEADGITGSSITDVSFQQETVYEDGAFMINPAPFDEAGNWEVTIIIGDETMTQATFRTRIFNRKPDKPLTFSLLMLVVPLIFVGGLAFTYRLSQVQMLSTPEPVTV